MRYIIRRSKNLPHSVPFAIRSSRASRHGMRQVLRFKDILDIHELKKMKIYPRHQLDIKFSDLGTGLLSYGFPLKRAFLEKQIISLCKRGPVRVRFSVRAAWDSLLTSLKLPEGSEVLMSSINIKDMVRIVENHGLHATAVELYF